MPPFCLSFTVIFIFLSASGLLADSSYLVYDVATQKETLVGDPAVDGSEGFDSRTSQPFVERGSYEIPYHRLQELAQARAVYPDYAMPSAELRQEDDGFMEFGIVGEDGREAVISTVKFPASAVVQIELVDANEERGLCSGAMISADTVLTVGHCVQSESYMDGSVRWHKDFTVFPGRNKAVEPYKHCGVKKIFVLSGWHGEDKAYDLAAMRLDCRVGEKTGHFGLRVAEAVEQPIVVQGYPADKTPEGGQFLSEDAVTGFEELRILHTADTVGGMSGAPAFSKSDHRIFGVHASIKHADDWTKDNNAALHNFATRITEERVGLVEQWIHHER